MKACKRAVDLIHMPTIAGPLPLLKTSIMAIDHQTHQFSRGRIHRKFALILLQIFPQIFAQIFFFQKFAQIFAKIFAQRFVGPNFFANNCAKICTNFF